jgi:hypothetical protein
VTQFIVVEGTTAQFGQAADDLAAVGWAVQADWSAPRGATTALCGEVDDRRSAETAVEAAIGGTALVLHGLAGRDILDALCGDLRHLGRLDHRVERPVAMLSPEQRRLLRLLADGAPVGTIAQALHLSRRSVDRRIAALRLTFGFESVGAVLAAYRERLARLDPPPSL